MTYCDADSDYDAVVGHLRNKNLGVYPRRWTPMLRLAERLYGQAAKLRHRTMRRAGWQAVVSEQILEGPLVLQNIRPEEHRVLDFGGYESLLPLTLSALGHEVTVLDQRPYPFKGPGLRSVTADLFSESPVPAGSFDLVVSISTIEHLGLGRYEDVKVADGDRLGVERLWTFLRSGGRLMASVPAGQPTVQRGYRTYDEARLRDVFPGIVSTLWFRKDHRLGAWAPSSAEAAGDVVYGAPQSRLPVEAVAFVICEKS